MNTAAAYPAIKARQQGIAGLSATCRQCPVVSSCASSPGGVQLRFVDGLRATVEPRLAEPVPAPRDVTATDGRS